tara:strand:+ start:12620 stop:13129 length:510 start_codon:yes stop_codon:yes gene_type:complete
MEKKASIYFRIIHRYLGYYLVGIMAVYSVSGITLIFRRTDTFKKVTEVKTQHRPKLNENELGKDLKIRNLKFINSKGDIYYFEDGQYNRLTGETRYLKKEVPYILKKMQRLHKATTQSPVYWLNIFFGASLMFFVISSFWMFLPNTTVFKKGIIFSLAGVIMTIIILFI